MEEKDVSRTRRTALGRRIQPAAIFKAIHRCAITPKIEHGS
jgi:hypothetical protein